MEPTSFSSPELHYFDGPLKPGLHHFLSRGPAGAIEILTQQPPEWDQTSIALLCHPNPLQEGTMHNKVVTTLSKAYISQGIATVRFQFRGVGQSEGEHGGGITEQSDVLALIEMLRRHHPAIKIHLTGFSFGAYVSTAVASQIPTLLQSLISVAPAVTMRDFSGFKGITCPWLVIQGDEDEVVPLAQVLSTFNDLTPYSPGLEIVQILGGSHFFHGKLIELNSLLVHFLQSHRES